MLSDTFRLTLHTPMAAFLGAYDILPMAWLPGFNTRDEMPWHNAYVTMMSQAVRRAGRVPSPTPSVVVALPAASPVTTARAGAGASRSVTAGIAEQWQRWVDTYLREHGDAHSAFAQLTTIKTWLTPAVVRPTAAAIMDSTVSSTLFTTHLQLKPGEEHTLAGMQKMVHILQRLHDVLPARSSEASEVQGAIERMKTELAFAQSHVDLVTGVFGDATHAAQATALLTGEPLTHDVGKVEALARALAEEREAVRVKAAYDALGDALDSLNSNLPADGEGDYALPDDAMDKLRRLMGETVAQPIQISTGSAGGAGAGVGASGTVHEDLARPIEAIVAATKQADAQAKVTAVKGRVDTLFAAAEAEVGRKQESLTAAQAERDAVSGICLARVVHMKTRLTTYPLIDIAAPGADAPAVTRQLHEAYLAAKKEAEDYQKEKGGKDDYHEVRVAMLWAHAWLLGRVYQGLADGNVAPNVAVLMLAMVVQQRDMAPALAKEGIRDDLKDLTAAPNADTVMRSGVARMFGGVGKSASINGDELTETWHQRVIAAQLVLSAQPEFDTTNVTGQTQWQALLALETTLRNQLWMGEAQYIGIAIADALDVITRAKHACIAQGQNTPLDGEAVNLIVRSNFRGLRRPSTFSVSDNEFVQALAPFGEITWGDHAWHKQVGRLNAQQLKDYLTVETVSDHGLASTWRRQVIAQECGEIACLDNTAAQAHIARRVVELQQVKALDEMPERIALQQLIELSDGEDILTDEIRGRLTQTHTALLERLAHAVLDATPHYKLDRDFARHMQQEVVGVRTALAEHHWPLLHQTLQVLVNLKASGFDIEPYTARFNALVDSNAPITEAAIMAFREQLVLAYIEKEHAELHGQLAVLRQQQDAACAAGFPELPKALGHFRYEAILATIFERFQAGSVDVRDLMGHFNGDLTARLSSFSALLQETAQSLRLLMDTYAGIISPASAMVADTEDDGSESKAQPEDETGMEMSPPPCCTALVSPLSAATAAVVGDPGADLTTVWEQLQEEGNFFFMTVQPHAQWLEQRQGVFADMSSTLCGEMRQAFVKILQQDSDLPERESAMQDLLARHQQVEAFCYSEAGDKLVAIRARCLDVQRHMQALRLSALPTDLANVGKLLAAYDYSALTEGTLPATYDTDMEKLQKSQTYCRHLWQVRDVIRQYAGRLVDSVQPVLSESDLYTSVRQGIVASNRHTRDLHTELTQLEQDVSALSGDEDLTLLDPHMPGEAAALRGAILTAVGEFMTANDGHSKKNELEALQVKLRTAEGQPGNAFEWHARDFLQLAEPAAFAAAASAAASPASPMRRPVTPWHIVSSPATDRGSAPARGSVASP